MRRRVVSLVLAAAVALTACEKVNTVASSVSPCFRVLPVAQAAVGGQGRFVDVARLQPRDILGLRRLRTAVGITRRSTTTAGPTSTIVEARGVCAVAYQGAFDPSRISRLVGPRTGKYAVVYVGILNRRVAAVVLSDNLSAALHPR